MPHKCARCGKFYDEGAPELMEGCDCGSHVFLYLKAGNKTEKEAKEKLKDKELKEEDLEWLEDDISWLEDKGKKSPEAKTIHLDVENLNRIGRGKYQLDISSLMKGEPVVFKEKEGVYFIDIAYGMKNKSRDNERSKNKK